MYGCILGDTSLKSPPLFSHSAHTFRISSHARSPVFSLTVDESSTIALCILSSPRTAFSFDSPAHIPCSKMKRLNAFFAHSTIAFALFFCTPICHIASGLKQLTAAYLLNRHPCKPAALASPFELLYGIAPSYQHLRVFGCLCFPNTTATALHELAPRSSKCVFLGYPTDHKGYRCYDLSTR